MYKEGVGISFSTSYIILGRSNYNLRENLNKGLSGKIVEIK